MNTGVYLQVFIFWAVGSDSIINTDSIKLLYKLRYYSMYVQHSFNLWNCLSLSESTLCGCKGHSASLTTDHSKVKPFEIQPSNSAVFEWIRFSNGRFSDPHVPYQWNVVYRSASHCGFSLRSCCLSRLSSLRKRWFHWKVTSLCPRSLLQVSPKQKQRAPKMLVRFPPKKWID